VRNSHNAYNETGILQNLYVDAGKGNFLEAGIWYQRKTLEIPAIMGSYGNSNAVQKDSLFRSFISYRKNGTRSALLVRSAYLSDHLNFIDRAGLDSMASINSRIAASRIINEIDYRRFITSRLIAGGGVSYNLIYGRSDNYGGRISENEIAAYGNVKYIFKDLIVNAGIRKEFHEEFNPEPQFSSGIRYMVRKGLVLRTSFSSKFRKPSLNEKYWNPGGNPYLRPEKGYGGEFTVEWNFLGDRTSGSWMETKVTAYYQAVDNWIQWVMTDSLTPVEYKKVHAKGIDTWIEYGFAFTSFKIAGFFNYSLNRSTIIGTYDNNPLFEGNQLIYVPKHTFRVSGDIKYKNLFFGISAAYSGIRETVETGDKSLQLHPFSLFDASLGYIRSIHNVPVAFWCRLDNLFDAEYEIIRSYPVPGRTFHLTLTVGFEKIVKK